MEKLKKMGIYDSSCIILQADHGTGYPPKNMNDEPPPLKKTTDISPNIVGRALALLAIKPQSSRGRLKISNAQTAITDIPSTIMELTRLENPYKDRSISIFNIHPGEKRERVFNIRYFKHNQDLERECRGERDSNSTYYFLFKVTGSLYDYKSWKLFGLNQSQTKKYQWGTEITFGLIGNSYPYEENGWSQPNNKFTWTENRQATMTFPVSIPKDASNIVLVARFVRAHLFSGKLDSLKVNILVNDIKVGSWEIKNNDKEKTLKIPLELLKKDAQKMKITFDMPDVISPKQAGEGNDPRLLGIAFMSIKFNSTSNSFEQ